MKSRNHISNLANSISAKQFAVLRQAAASPCRENELIHQHPVRTVRSLIAKGMLRVGENGVLTLDGFAYALLARRAFSH